MPRNGSGTYSLPAGNPVVTGTTISSTVHNNTMNDIASELTNSMDRDGQTTVTGDFDFNANKLVLDLDGDTSITADTDDLIDFEINSIDAIKFGWQSAPFTGFVTIDPTAFTADATEDTHRFAVKSTRAITIPAGTTPLVASGYFEEPNIIATGTVTSATTVYIHEAPTEGNNNYALWVNDGVSRLDGGAILGDITQGHVLVGGGTSSNVSGVDMTTAGDILCGDGSGAPSVVNMGTAGDILAGDGSGVPSVVNLGTKGDLLAGDGSGAPRALGVGSNDDVLTADSGEASGLKWAPAPQGLVLISTATASNDASVSFTSGIDSTYDEYVIIMDNVRPATDNIGFYCRTSSNGGSSYDSGSNNYVGNGSAISGTSVTSVNASSTEIRITSGTGNNVSLGGISLHLNIIDPSNSGIDTHINWTGGHGTDSGAVESLIGSCRRDAIAAVNAIQFFFASGNIASGKFKLYGLRKS